MQALIKAHGRAATTEAVRGVLADWRAALGREGAGEVESPGEAAPNDATIVARVGARLDAAAQTMLRPVLNLTGTLLHTNLGRAPLPAEAIEGWRARRGWNMTSPRAGGASGTPTWPTGCASWPAAS